MKKYYIYLDQNILGLFLKGKPEVMQLDNVVWLYSNEHFIEMKRSNDRRFLGILDNMDAKMLSLVADENTGIKSPTFNPELKAVQAYDEFKQSWDDSWLDDDFLIALLLRIMGANNLDILKKSINRFYEDLCKTVDEFVDDTESQILEESGLDIDLGYRQLKDMKEQMQFFVDNDLSDVSKLEEMRKSMGIDKGRLGNIHGDKAINEIWGILNFDKFGISCDQFFGFDPLSIGTQAGQPITKFNGIVSCHLILNILGFKTDKGMTNYKKLKGSLSDGRHIAYASFCHGLISLDERLCNKAKAIFKYRGIKSKITYIKENKPE